MAALHRLGVLDTEPDLELDELVGLLARVFDVSSASVSLVDSDKQWFWASVGVAETQTPRDVAFCDQTIRQSSALVVEDATKDARFAANLLVTGEPFIRFYAGAPLVTRDGAAVGAVCVFDARVRTASPYQLSMLEVVAQQVVDRLELQSAGRLAAAAADGRASAVPPQAASAGRRDEHLRRLMMHGTTGFVEADVDGTITFVNRAAARMLGFSPSQMVGRPSRELSHPDHVGAVARLREAGRRTYDATRVYRHRDGRAVQLHCTVSMIPGVTEGSVSTAALLTDLSGQVAAGTYRVRAERAFQRVLETATDAFISMDADGTVLEWNASAERLFGYTSGDAVGASLVDLVIPTHLLQAHRAAIRRLVLGGEPAAVGQVLELPAMHRDGHVVQIELTPWMDVLEDGTRRFHAFCRDIGGRIAAREALLEANRALDEGQAQLRAAFDASPTADALLDADGVLVRVNPAMCRFLGAGAAELVGARLTDVVHQQDRTLVTSAWSGVARGDVGVYRSELRFLRGHDGDGPEGGDGPVLWGLASLVPVEPAGGRERGMLRIESLQAHKELESALLLQASHEPVSGLPNLSLFVERVRQALETSGDRPPVAVLVLQVEGLPAVIDRHGFPAGDRVLALVARRLRDRTPADVTLAHLQPGRFAAVVPGGVEVATVLAEGFLESFSPVTLKPPEVVLGAAVGVADASGTRAAPVAVRIGRLVQDAEGACRLARSEGPGTVRFAAPEMRAAQQRRHDLEALIRGALADDRVQVAYQPVYELSSGSLVGVEALLRVHDTMGRPVPPLDVIPAAEASGLILGLGRQVLREAASQVARWRDQHGVVLPVAVNVSAVQLAHDRFCADVLSAVQEAGVPPGSVSLELTESVLLDAGSVGVARLHELSAAGISLAIDDFGTGYASLSYLRDLPATTLKIDRSFVEGIPGDHGAMAIVASVIGLARNFGLVCVAEGIETQAQLDYLTERGVLGQGFLLGRPGDARTIGALLSGGGSTDRLRRNPVPSLADQRDDAGDRRDLAGDERDEVGDDRDRAGDERDTAGDRRDQVADRRDRAGDRRDLAADDRDEAADVRDLAGTGRDDAAARRDAVAERADGEPGSEDPVLARDRSRAAREGAALDRSDAEQDRVASAGSRAGALADRRVALEDRAAGAAGRLGSELDRTIALADRGAGAGERELAGGDRSVSHGDRGASADERHDSSTDASSGAYTRVAGLAELSREVDRCARQGRPLVLVVVQVEPSEGLVRAAASALRAGLRSYDLVLRHDRSTFVCALSELGPEAATTRFLSISRLLAGGDPRGSLAFGAAERVPDDTVGTLMARARTDLQDGLGVPG